MKQRARTWALPTAFACTTVVLLAVLFSTAWSGSRTARSTQVAPRYTPIQLLAQPPALTPEQLDQREDALDQLWEIRRKIEYVPPSPTAVPQTAPRNPATSAQPRRMVAAPGDFTVYRNTILTDAFTDNSTSSTNEPSVGMGCNNVLYSGNWYASLSTDYGQTFSFIDPDVFFPGFCCDQVVYWDDSRGLMFWYLQAGFSFTGNTVRLAVTDDPANITGSLVAYDLTPQFLGYGSDVNFDYPDLATSNNYLYVMTNAFSITLADTDFVAGIVMAINLDELAAMGTVNVSWFSDDVGTIRPTQGAAGTMYFGSHPDLATVRIYTWAEGAGSIPVTDEGVDLFYTGHSAPSPDGTDWMAFSDTRTLGGFVASGQVGFMWNSAQGGPYDWPNVRWARFDEASLTLDDEGAVWNDDFAWGYPSVHPNSDGEYAGTICYGGGDYYPNLQAWIADSFNGLALAPLENAAIAVGTDGPIRDRWGDYNTCRQNDPFGDTWVGTGFVLNGGNTNTEAEPHMIWFGREEDTPDLAPDITCPSDVTVECSSHNGTPKNDPQLVAFFAGVSATAVCGGVTITNDAPNLFPEGQTTTVTFTATDDGGETATCTADVTVEDTTPPDITCPDDVVVECSDHCGTPADDPQLVAFFAAASATDVCDPAPTLTNDAPDCFPHVPSNETIVTFTAKDEDNNTNSCTAKVTVVDTTPPEIEVTLDRDVLWPPNHKLAEVCADVVVTDICDPDPTFVLLSIASDEPDNANGDGSTTSDIQDAALGTPDVCFLLRSERQGGEDGRKYTIIYEASDHDGNTASDTVCVEVPHDQGGGAHASSGFAVDGTQFTADAERFALIIPSVEGMDPASIDRSRIYVGNTAGVAVPQEIRVAEINADGRPDLVAFFSTERASELLTAPGMVNVNDPVEVEGGLSKDRGNGPVGLHYVTATGGNYLVSNIIALGTPVALPGIWVEGPPPILDLPEVAQAPRETGLKSIHPNPFNPQTTVEFTLLSPGRVTIAIYSVTGTLVRRLVDETRPAGDHAVEWRGEDDAGRQTVSGIYFVRMIAGRHSETRKIVMLK